MNPLAELSKEELIKIIEEQKKQIEDLNGTVKKLDRRNKFLSEYSRKTSKTESSYDNPFKPVERFQKNWTWITKIVYVLQTEKRPLLSSEIAELLKRYDAFAGIGIDLRKALSVHLNNGCHYERIKSVKFKGLKAQYYALPEWFDKSEQLLPEYRIQPKFR